MRISFQSSSELPICFPVFLVSLGRPSPATSTKQFIRDGRLCTLGFTDTTGQGQQQGSQADAGETLAPAPHTPTLPVPASSGRGTTHCRVKLLWGEGQQGQILLAAAMARSKCSYGQPFHHCPSHFTHALASHPGAVGMSCSTQTLPRTVGKVGQMDFVVVAGKRHPPRKARPPPRSGPEDGAPGNRAHGDRSHLVAISAAAPRSHVLKAAEPN